MQLELTQLLLALLAAFALLGLGFGIDWVARRLIRKFPSSHATGTTLAQLVTLLTETSLSALTAQLARLDPAQHESAIKTAADAVYAAFPEVIVLSVGGVPTEIPLKTLVSQQLFESACLTSYKGVEDIFTLLEDELQKAAAAWHTNGRTLPTSATVHQLAG